MTMRTQYAKNLLEGNVIFSEWDDEIATAPLPAGYVEISEDEYTRLTAEKAAELSAARDAEQQQRRQRAGEIYREAAASIGPVTALALAQQIDPTYEPSTEEVNTVNHYRRTTDGALRTSTKPLDEEGWVEITAEEFAAAAGSAPAVQTMHFQAKAVN